MFERGLSAQTRRLGTNCSQQAESHWDEEDDAIVSGQPSPVRGYYALDRSLTLRFQQKFREVCPSTGWRFQSCRVLATSRENGTSLVEFVHTRERVRVDREKELIRGLGGGGSCGNMSIATMGNGSANSGEGLVTTTSLFDEDSYRLGELVMALCENENTRPKQSIWAKGRIIHTVALPGGIVFVRVQFESSKLHSRWYHSLEEGGKKLKRIPMVGRCEEEEEQKEEEDNVDGFVEVSRGFVQQCCEQIDEDCIVCCSQPSTIVWPKCGHQVLCQGCFAQLKRGAGKCPICRIRLV